MTHTLVEFGIAGLSLISFFKLLPQLTALVRDVHSRWLSLALLTLIAGGMLGDTRALTDVPAFKLLYAGLFLALIFVSLTAPPLRSSTTASLLPLFLILVFWAWLFAVNTVQNASSSSMGELLIRLAPGALWIALLAVWRRSPISREMLAVVAAFALTIPGLMLPFIGEAWRPCDDFKCGAFGGMLTGAYTSENYLSQQVALVLVLYLSTFGMKNSLHFLALTAAWLLATESRTAQYALIAGLAVVILAAIGKKLFKFPRRKGPSLLAQTTLFFTPLLFISTASYFALTASPEDFSNRGSVWISAIRVLREEPLIGQGIDRWSYFQQLGLLPSHFPHSLYVFIAFSGGIVGLVLLFFWLSQSLIVTAKQSGGLSTPLVLGIVIMTLGLLEVVWNPIAVDGTSWIPLMIMSVSRPAPYENTLDTDTSRNLAELQK
ncbi:O-antigen ligase family protein [Leucobacter sp. CSA1]|uniref:O-antigen ligase family protein n=1 Tax=Leucobacter chromiisoli TaxID=2796471 RepID=A0A934UUG8_9MICO|nr:O-antigen ligase family protein [Leucobacter chromiisoli]MBK0419479.1 O-antigen ligase family protein [Leucobacter chromiisoli]